MNDDSWHKRVYRLVAASRAVWHAYYDLEMRDPGDFHNEFKELYNATLAITYEECKHEWFPKIETENEKPFTRCGKCGFDRSTQEKRHGKQASSSDG